MLTQFVLVNVVVGFLLEKMVGCMENELQYGPILYSTNSYGTTLYGTNTYGLTLMARTRMAPTLYDRHSDHPTPCG